MKDDWHDCQNTEFHHSPTSGGQRPTHSARGRPWRLASPSVWPGHPTRDPVSHRRLVAPRRRFEHPWWGADRSPGNSTGEQIGDRRWAAVNPCYQINCVDSKYFRGADGTPQPGQASPADAAAGNRYYAAKRPGVRRLDRFLVTLATGLLTCGGGPAEGIRPAGPFLGSLFARGVGPKMECYGASPFRPTGSACALFTLRNGLSL